MSPQIRLVLVRTSHPGNIGAVVRLMKNMALTQLVLVRPDGGREAVLSEVAVARAAGGAALLQQAILADSLAEAVADCDWVAGTSARSRSMPWPVQSPRAFIDELESAPSSGPRSIAVVFGREDSGLTNEELQLCNRHIMIPANPEYPVLNIAMAAQIMAYELYQMMLRWQPGRRPLEADAEAPLASSADVEAVVGALTELAVSAGFLDPAEPRQFGTHIRRLFRRAPVQREETNLLRGLLKALQRKLP
ncbi:RNA methyltransferase [Allohahella marinimesophila]|uniref:tRNA (cytidine/uridine-2'-O-)-methyltransferase TrmJ n=1 Tax=Allohahella marinimesophila TaxID=1054972 RepID=A0ABP7P4Z6_9GAMM